MSTAILTTKLHMPTARGGVQRPRLIERLNEGAGRSLTLISAPAGSGKTTLVGQWVAHAELPVAWLSLDEADSDPVRFMTYLIHTLRHALQTVQPEIGEAALNLLQSPQPPPAESLLTTLVNEMNSLEGRFVLVLDDYHRVDAQAVDDALTFLLEHLPAQLHLVITTREDPHLPLARLRARAQLLEIRAADLRFTHAEAAAFLEQMTGLALSAEAVAALETRTEGWIAGLQLAALSMQGRDDTAHFIDAFAGSHRFVLDYLMEEVLDRQPEDVRRFLLQTAILARLNAGLCDSVTGESGTARVMLETLERGNLFVVALDDTRQWYRYHHLFADALQIHLANEQPDLIPALHMRACGWYDAHNFPADAIHHALAAPDYERAADLLEKVWPEMDALYQNATWMRWANQLPDGMIGARPMLNLGMAWALLNAGDLDGAAEYLGGVENWLASAHDEDAGRLSSAWLDNLRAAIASAQAYRALTLGDVQTTLENTGKALALVSDVHHPSHRQAKALSGIAYWVAGDLQTADAMLEDFMTGMIQAGHLHDAVGIPFILWEIRRLLGTLHRAHDAFQRSLKLIERDARPMYLGTGEVYRGLCELSMEWGDFDAAAAYLQTCHTMPDEVALPTWEYRLCLTESLYKQALGDFEGALALLEEAESLYTPAPVPETRPIAARKARIWIQQGDLGAADEWARLHGVTPHDALHPLREYEHIILARLLIAHSLTHSAAPSSDEAHHLLERLLHAAESGDNTGGRIGSMIEILILQALAYQSEGKTAAAFAPLRRALALAEPEAYSHVFVGEGQPMQALLESLVQQSAHEQHGGSAPYLRRLQAAFYTQPEHAPSADGGLLDPLSDREMEVLLLLATELSGPEIAGKLMVSLNTMRTHTKNIYSKLGVNSRRSAVRRATELNLL